MSQMLSMDRSRGYQRYGEQSNLLSFSGSHLLILCLSVSRLKNYTGKANFLILSSYSSALCIFLFLFLLFHSESEFTYLFIFFTYLNKVETRSCLPSRLDTFWRMRILREWRCFKEAFILKLGPCCYLTFLFLSLICSLLSFFLSFFVLNFFCR